jgi:hypothetical protein
MIVAQILYIASSFKGISYFFFVIKIKKSDEGETHIQKLSHNTWMLF